MNDKKEAKNIAGIKVVAFCLCLQAAFLVIVAFLRLRERN